jgi:hypothetical protein
MNLKLRSRAYLRGIIIPHRRTQQAATKRGQEEKADGEHRISQWSRPSDAARFLVRPRKKFARQQLVGPEG